MMTETTGQSPCWSDPRLAPLQHAALPSFILGWPPAGAGPAIILHATQSCARMGLPSGAPAPVQAADIARNLMTHRNRPFALVRLRLPAALSPQMFYCTVVDLNDGPAVLFADPAACAQQAEKAEPEKTPQPLSGPETAAIPETLSGDSEPAGETPPLRFIFETDEANRLRGISPLLARALGDDAKYWHGASFQELEDGGWIISAAAICEALVRGGSFAGVRVTTPGPIVLDLELGGIPLFDGARRRVATRGFGVLRTWPNTRTSSWISSLTPEENQTVREPQPMALLNGSLSPRDTETFRDIGRTLNAVMAQENEPEETVSNVEPEPDLPSSPEDMEQVSVIAPPAPEPAPEPEMPGPRTTELLDALPFATLLERDGTVLHLNRTFLEWTGWASLSDFRTSNDASALIEMTEEGEARLATAEGELLQLGARPVEMPFLAPSARLLVLRRLEKPATRHAAEAREQALDLVPWPVLLLDRDCLIHFANRATGTLLGFQVADLVGQPLTIAIPPDARGAAIGWIDSVAQDESTRVDTSPLTLRTRADEQVSMQAGLARMDADGNQLCLVLGPRETAPEAPQAEETQADSSEVAPPDHAQGESDALHRAARRLKDSLTPALTTLLDHPTDETTACALPTPVADALRAVQQCLSDLASLATPAPESAGTSCDPALIVEEAITHISLTARRCRITLRPDIQAVPEVISQPAHLARLVRIMLEEALEATPARATVFISLSCNDEAGTTPVVLEIADGGPALDEVALAHARAPLSVSADTDRFSQGGRPLRFARMAAEVEAIGARFSIRRGQSHGMHALLELPR